MPLPVAIAAATAAVSIGTSIAGVADAGKRRLYEQNLSLLNVEEKRKLDSMLMSAKSEEARQQILASTLGNIGSARVSALATVQAEKEKTKKTLLIVGIGAVVVLVVGLIYISTKKK
jgi:hypothetical protein